MSKVVAAVCRSSRTTIAGRTLRSQSLCRLSPILYQARLPHYATLHTTAANLSISSWLRATISGLTSTSIEPNMVVNSNDQASSIPPPPATRQLTASDGPLVWIDCEMTGLDAENDRLLEVACIITDGSLKPLDNGVSYVIRTDKKVLDSMNEWCVNQHGKSGLTEACLDPKRSHHHADVRAAILAYILDRVPTKGIACLAGNTVHADATFLKKEMPEITNHLHYRIVDVSTIKELVGRWYGDGSRWTGGKGSHRALDDIRASIEELGHYQRTFFVMSGNSNGSRK